MQYPGDWHQQADGDQATFASAASRDVLAVFTDPNDVGNTATTIANNAMSDFMKTVLSSAQAAQVAPTIQLDGANWVQLSATGMLTSDPGVEGNFYLLVTNYPSTGPNVIAYEIEYYGPASTFNVGNVDFQAMLQSFQFVVPVKTATPGT
jgi:hypothetical protein